MKEAPREYASYLMKPRPRLYMIATGPRLHQYVGVRPASGRGSGRRARARRCCPTAARWPASPCACIAGSKPSVRCVLLFDAVELEYPRCTDVLLFAPQANVLFWASSTA